MGAACCIAARDGTIQHGSSGEILHRNFRHSPTWSFHWDNRVGVADEETSIGWLSDVGSRNDMLDLKSATDVSAHVSDGGSSVENYQMSAWHKSPLKHDETKNLSTSIAGQSHARTVSLEVKQSAESPQVSGAISVKHASPMHSTPSFSMLPPSSQSHLLPPSPNSCQWPQGSPGNQVAQPTSDGLSSFQNSPSMNSISEGADGIPAPSNESTRGSYGRSSDGWSTYAFPELMSTSQREQWTFDSNSCSFNRDKSRRASGRTSGSMSMDFQICGICSKLVTEKSAWSSQKIVAGNELSVIAVLICGHVYHADCLETITPEINKYDPACPVCTFGEKQTLKLAGKLKAERDIKARYKRSRNRIMDNDASFDFDYWKSRANEEKSPKLSTSSSLKISSAKPFLKRHFSFQSKGNKSTTVNPPIWKKGFFWAKSSRV